MVELLAVITILSVILLIVVPILNGVIRDSKENSNKDSINLYGKAIENAVATYFAKYPDEDYVSYEKLQEEKMINYRGNKVECDTIYIVERKVYLADCKVGGKIVEGSYGTKIKNMLGEAIKISETDETTEFINTGIENYFISKLIIDTSGTDIENSNEYESKDCSLNQDKSVMCYWKEDLNNSEYYEMTIAADGEIYAPYNSSYLFHVLSYDKPIDLNLEGLNTQYTVNMSHMFDSTGHNFMQSLDLGDKFDTSNVIDMSHMFDSTGINDLQSLNLGDKFDTSNVIDMSGMFLSFASNSNHFDNLNLGNKFDTSNVTNMSKMFASTGMRSMINLNLGNKFDTSKVKNMSHMFNITGYNSMTNLSLGDKFDTTNVTDMLGMFSGTGYNSMANLSLGDKFDTTNVTNMSRMFWDTGYNSMIELNLGKKFVINDDTSIDAIFVNCGIRNSAMRVIVPTTNLQNKILGLNETNDRPSFWNNTIVQVQ